MELITKKGLLKGLAKRWEEMYRYQIKSGDNKSSLIYKRLLENPHLTKEKATEIIGNSSWTRNICDECNNESEAVVLLGQEIDYESSTAAICLHCLRAAIQLIEADV